MNPFIQLCVNGNIFFVGMFLCAIALGLKSFVKRKYPQVGLRLVLIVGFIFVIISSTPFSIFIYLIWSAALFGSFALMNPKHNKRSKIRISSIAIFLILSLSLCLIESRYRIKPSILMHQDQLIYVIGDSISAGLEDGEKTWPEVLSEKHDLKVVNLARAGATVRSVLDQADEISSTSSIVLLEIGGNDLLGETKSNDFNNQLNQILMKLKQQKHKIIIFELPLPPLHNSYGKIQRRLSKEYNAELIPKRFMTKVIAAKETTVDGLHLSSAGHDWMADIVWDMIDLQDSSKQ